MPHSQVALLATCRPHLQLTISLVLGSVNPWERMNGPFPDGSLLSLQMTVSMVMLPDTGLHAANAFMMHTSSVSDMVICTIYLSTYTKKLHLGVWRNPPCFSSL